MTKIKQWFYTRETREQYLLIIAAILITLLLMHALIWTPIVTAYEQTSTRLERLEKDLRWMRKTARTLQALQPAITQQPGNGIHNQSMETLIYKSAKSLNLDNSIKRTTPKGKQRYRIRLEAASFNTLIQWVEMLRKQYAIHVRYIDISKSTTSGLVNSSLVLNR